MYPAFTTPLAIPNRAKPLLSHSLTPRLPPTLPTAILEELAPPASLPTQTSWTPSSWRSHRALQQPVYPDLHHLARVETTLARMPPLVAFGEMRGLKEQLAHVALGHGFVLQGGDCAEDLMEASEGVTDTVRALFKMAVVLMWGSQEPVVKIGRLAGQYGKPRSSDAETRGGVTLPSYRGEVSCTLYCSREVSCEVARFFVLTCVYALFSLTLTQNINGAAFTPEARAPDPDRMLLAYNRSAGTTNLVRALASGGFADLKRVMEWGMDWSMHTNKGREYMATAQRIAEALHFMETCGVHHENPVMTSTEVFTSHEGLLLPYEQALTRQDPVTGEYFCCSGHFIWIGERTRGIDDAHVEFARGIANRKLIVVF